MSVQRNIWVDNEINRKIPVTFSQKEKGKKSPQQTQILKIFLSTVASPPPSFH